MTDLSGLKAGPACSDSVGWDVAVGVRVAVGTVRGRVGVGWARRRQAAAAGGDATVRRELGVAFGVAAVWPVTVFAVALMVWATIAQFHSVQRERQQVAARVAGSIDHMVDVGTRTMQAAAAVGDPAEMTPGAVEGLLGRLLQTQNEVDELSFIDARGKRLGIASSLRRVDAGAPVFEGARETAASAVDTGEVAIGGGFHETIGGFVYAIAVPTTESGTGRGSGALVGVTPMTALAELLADVNAETGGSSYIVTVDGRLVADANLDRVFSGTTLPDVSGGLSRGIGGTPIIAGTAPLAVGDGAVVVVSAENAGTAMAPAALAIIPCALLMCLVVVAHRVRDRLIRRIVEPIETLAQSTRQLAGGDLTARAETSDIVEFDLLANDFNGMATRLQETVTSLEDRTRRLADSNRQLEEFASVAAHDLREPLRKIQFFGDRLDKMLGDDCSDPARDYVARMSGAARRMSELIESLLTYSRVSTKTAPFEPVDLNTTVRGVLGDLEAAIADNDADITVGDLPVVDADPMQMRQLFQNLLSNALKYHEPGSPVDVVITADASGVPPASASASTNGDRARVLVSDNGIGIDPIHHDEIFRVFSRLHRRAEYEGTGIGLAVCRRIVDRHDGSIVVTSAPGEGSTFVVSLPRHSSLEDP